MTSKVRPAEPDDLSSLLELVASKAYPGSRIDGIDSRLRRECDLRALRENWQNLLANGGVKILVAGEGAVEGYLIAGCGQSDFATGQPETVVVEHAGPLEHYPALFETLKSDLEDDFLAIRVYPEESDLQGCLRACGFAPEFTRVVRAARSEAPAPPVEGLHVRRAHAADRAFLAQLHIDCSPFYESSHRQGADWGAFAALDNYLSLDLDRAVAGWIAELEGKAAGYVLLRPEFALDMLERKGAYLYDIAVVQAAWGRNLVRPLHEAAVREVGYQTIVGDISAHNSRALHVALNKLNYQVEWERWGFNL